MMTKIKAGDTVIITNVEGIMFGKKAWKDGDVTTVAAIDSDGDAWLVTQKLHPDGSVWTQVDGKDTFLVTASEFVHLAKLLPVNGAEQTPKRAQGHTGERVRVVNHPYELTPEQSVGTIARRVRRTESRRGTYVVKLDDYMSLTFFPHEMEALEQ